MPHSARSAAQRAPRELRDASHGVTDAVIDEVQAWQARPLDPVWPIVFLDALVLKVRDRGVVQNKSAYIALGMGVDGHKKVLGIWLESTRARSSGSK
jgi:putative transposase